MSFQQNGVDERKHQHILQMVQILLLDSAVPASFWAEAVSTTVYVINHKFIQIFLINLLTFNFFIVALIITCFILLISMCSVLLPPSKRTKLTTQSIWCAFLRYGDGQKGFVCYDPQPKQLCILINITI